MFACFTVLVHVPMLPANRSSHANWSENAVNLAVLGAAWVVAGSLVDGTLLRREKVRAAADPGSR